MDALELDAYDGTTQAPDLLPGNLGRELRKAYTAFSSSEFGKPYQHTVAGLWGCGLFCGNPQIKTLIQWIAASSAGVPKMTIVVTTATQEFTDVLNRLMECVHRHELKLTHVLATLQRLKLDDVEVSRDASRQVMLNAVACIDL